MILAAGFGTRLRPLTLTIPKALINVNGKPMIVHVLNRLIDAGIKEVVINVHHFADQIEKFFQLNDFPLNINLIHEKEILGTGGGIKNAAAYLKDADNFLVHNADVMSEIDLNRLYTFHLNNGALATLSVQERSTSRPLLMDEKNHITGRVSGEKIIRYSAPHGKDSPVAFCGIHIISSEIFGQFPGENAFDIFTAYFDLLKKDKKIMGFDAGAGNWKDLGKYENVINA